MPERVLSRRFCGGRRETLFKTRQLRARSVSFHAHAHAYPQAFRLPTNSTGARTLSSPSPLARALARVSTRAFPTPPPSREIKTIASRAYDDVTRSRRGGRADGRAAEDHDTAPQQPVHFFGASANALFVTLEAAGYALVAFEFGSDDTACDTCEHNAWAVRADLLRARGFEPPDWHAMNKAYWKQHFALSNRAVLRKQGGKVDAHLQWRPGWRLSQVRSAARLACGHEGKLPKGHESEHGWRSLADYSALLASPQDFAVARQYGKRVSARLCGGAQKLGRVDGKDAADSCALDTEMVMHTTPTGLSHDARAAICAALEMP